MGLEVEASSCSKLGIPGELHISETGQDEEIGTTRAWREQ